MKLIPARPTPDNADHFAQLAQMAGDKVFTDLFGGRAHAALKSMYLQADNLNGHTHTTFLQEDSAIAGMLHAYSATAARDYAPRTNWLYLKYARLQIFRFLAATILLRDILGFIGENLLEGDYYIAFLAVYPQRRGRGHSKTLLNHASHLARQARCSRLALDVDEHNTIARAAYQQAGFEQISASKEVRIENERWRVLRLAKPVGPS
ncbi:MAG: GNAT family N-acetyltransferase [Chloroflexi bacterium]|nr:GNAT family N-acetyltransferase [Chloroflexota bacterium]